MVKSDPILITLGVKKKAKIPFLTFASVQVYTTAFPAFSPIFTYKRMPKLHFPLVIHNLILLLVLDFGEV